TLVSSVAVAKPSEGREHIDAVVVRDQYQRIVSERHVMPTVDKDVERKLSRRLWIDYQVPRAGDSGRVINWFAVTVERAASKCHGTSVRARPAMDSPRSRRPTGSRQSRLPAC